MLSRNLVGAFVFPEFWPDPSDAKSGIAALRVLGVNAIMTYAIDGPFLDFVRWLELELLASSTAWSPIVRVIA